MSDPATPRLVGGLWCQEVLAHLPDMVSGEAVPAVQAQVQAHLAQCDQCARFGGEYAATVAALLRGRPAQAPPPGLRARLLEKLG